MLKKRDYPKKIKAAKIPMRSKPMVGFVIMMSTSFPTTLFLSNATRLIPYHYDWFGINSKLVSD